MPFYEFECTKCGKLKEELQKFEDPAPDCDEAEHGQMKKNVFAPVVRKGAGIHSLDIGTRPSRIGKDLE